MSEQVPEGWEVCNFGKYAKVRNGFAFKSSDFKEKGNGSFPIIRMSNLKKGTLDLSDAVYVDDSVVSGLEPFALKPNDFVFGMSGSITNYGVVKKSNGICYQNQRVGRLQSLGSNQTYLSYLFTSDLITRKIELMAAGAAQVNISSTQIEELEVLFPPLPEQKKIASILTSVDEVIEKTQSQIDKLQDLKKGTMNELLTKGIGHTEFKDSELGRIPKSWEVKRLGEIGECVRGLTYSPSDIVDHGLLVLRSSNIQNDRLDFNDTVYVDVDINEQFKTKNGDILICVRNGSRNLIGKTAFIEKAPTHSTHGAFMTVFRSEMNSYVQHLMKSDRFFRYVSRDIGATINSINNGNLIEYRFPIPPHPEQKKIEKILGGIDNVLSEKNQKLLQTQSLKKSLMQDLLTGKVRVSVN